MSARSGSIRGCGTSALLGLSERIVTEESTLPPDVDWAAVRCRLTDEIDKSKAYIDKVLRDGEQ